MSRNIVITNSGKVIIQDSSSIYSIFAYTAANIAES